MKSGTSHGLASEVGRLMQAIQKVNISENTISDGTNSLDAEHFLSRSQKVRSIEKLPGDASTRKYYRVQTYGKVTPLNPSMELPHSLILMETEPFPQEGERLNFLAIQKHLLEAGVDVPKVIDFSAEEGFILLEDLGDTTLLRSLQEVTTPELERKCFERALDSIVTLHTHAGPAHSSAPIAGFQLKFNHEKLMWEIGFTLEHFFQKHLGREFKEQDWSLIQTGFSSICHELESQPTVFCHRDFHSRNIMIQGSPLSPTSRFVLIDFQDARMGPMAYDLASLLRDSYYQLDDQQVYGLCKYYYEQMKARHQPLSSFEEFVRVFDLMAIQRNFKAIGSFASFLNRRGNPAYLKYIGNTFENIRRSLSKYPEFSKLREVLYYYYYF